MTATSPVTFDDNISVNCSSTHSSAVFALYHDPELTEPYVGIPSYDIQQQQIIRLWPNPAHTTLNVENQDVAIDHLDIYDITGKSIFQLTVGNNGTSVDVSALPAGVYYLKAVCDGEITTSKFIKSSF